MEKIDTSIFKAYDIRGIYPEQINGEVVFRIAQAYAKFIRPKTVVVGHDMRLSGDEFKESATRGLVDAGVNVVDVGLVSTDQLYFAVVDLKADGGIMATASHNPKEFGGLKLVRQKGAPISGDNGIYEIRDMVAGDKWRVTSGTKGKIDRHDISEPYFNHVLSRFQFSAIKRLKVVANPNFGMAGVAVEYLKNKIPVEFVKVINGELNGNFPKGPPDPLRSENRAETVEEIQIIKPDLGVAWDADADRCFFFDENGAFVTPAYINALLSEYYLKRYPGGKIVHDTRVVRVIDYEVQKNNGISIATKAGHSFIKERMINEDAVFGTETSGHYYFKDNFYLDNGLLPFLAVLDILLASQKTFSQILKPLRDKFYISEEINFEFKNQNILEDIKTKYADAEIDATDGYSFNYKDWRFNVRKSNTENLLRINLETDSAGLLEQKIVEVSKLINEIK